MISQKTKMYQNAISYPDLNVKVDAFVYLIFFSWNNVKQHGSTEYINGKLRVGFRYRTTRPHKQPIYQTKYIVLPFYWNFQTTSEHEYIVYVNFYSDIKENKHSINGVRKNPCSLIRGALSNNYGLIYSWTSYEGSVLLLKKQILIQ